MSSFLAKFFENDEVKAARKRAEKAFKDCQKAIKESKFFDDFDFEKFDADLEEVTNTFASKFNKSIQEVEERFNTFSEEIKKFVNEKTTTGNPYEVVVAYDRDTDILRYSLEGDTLTVEVESVDNPSHQRFETVKRSFECVADFSHSYDKEKKEMKFTIIPCEDLEDDEDETEDVLVDEDENIEVGEEEFDELEEDLTPCGATVPCCEEDVCPLKNACADVDEHALNLPDGVEPNTINADIWQLYQSGESYRSIGRKVGLSDKTVARRIKTWLS